MIKKLTIHIVAILAAYTAFNSPIRSAESVTGNTFVSEEVPFYNPYISDGLVAMWDAIWNVGFGIHDENAPSWKDLISGVIAVPDNFKKSGDYQFGWGDDFCSIRHCNLAISSRMITNTINQDECTVEFALTRSDGTQRFYFLDGGTGLGTWQNDWHGIYICKGANNVRTIFGYPIGFVIGTTGSLTCVFSSGARTVYWNGEKLGEYSAEESPSVDITSLFGCRYPYADFTTCADIYFARIYNRALTEEEVSHNHEVDKSRFAL